MRSWNRIFNLYINYQIVFLLFIPLACFIRPQNYPGNLTEFICNFIALDCSYNREWWFFLPYVLLVISSKHIFNILDKLDLKTTLTTVTVLCIFTLLQILSENLYSVPVNHYRFCMVYYSFIHIHLRSLIRPLQHI